MGYLLCCPFMESTSLDVYRIPPLPQAHLSTFQKKAHVGLFNSVLQVYSTEPGVLFLYILNTNIRYALFCIPLYSDKYLTQNKYLAYKYITQ